MNTPDDGSRRIAATPDTSVQQREVYPSNQQVPAGDPTLIRPTPTAAPAVPSVEQHRADTRPTPAAKTSTAAVFALVFGLAALFCALTAILSPVAIVLGIIGLVLAAAGLKMARKPGITGRGVAIGGLVTALLGIILGGVVIGGVAAIVNNKSQLDRIQTYIDDARAKLPSTSEVRNSVPGQ